MRIGIKPGQIGLSAQELPEYWRAAEAAGFESAWTFDHLTGPTACPEAVTLLAAMAMTTQRVRIGCLVLANGTRQVETLAAQLATVDALSGGRLEVGFGVSSSFARLDFDALGCRTRSGRSGWLVIGPRSTDSSSSPARTRRWRRGQCRHRCH